MILLESDSTIIYEIRDLVYAELVVDGVDALFSMG